MPVLTRLCVSTFVLRPSLSIDSQARSLVRLPRELRDEIYQYVLETALIEVPEPITLDGGSMVMRHFYARPRFFLQTPDLLLVSRQIREEAREVLNKYVVIEMAPMCGGLGFEKFLRGMTDQAARFRQVQQLVIPQDMLQKALDLVKDGQHRVIDHFSGTQNVFRDLEVVVWPNGGDEREATIRLCFHKPDLQLMDVEYGIIEDESHEDEDPTEFGRHDYEGWMPKFYPKSAQSCGCSLQTTVPMDGSRRLVIRHPETHGSS